ncbi:hypothetical protein Gorai_003360, partial [Gossypium raimondii]|nr:hypothetical protein [Gossypium raimondii]
MVPGDLGGYPPQSAYPPAGYPGQSSHGHAVGGLIAGGAAAAYGAHRIAHGHGGLFGRGKFKHEKAKFKPGKRWKKGSKFLKPKFKKWK